MRSARSQTTTAAAPTITQVDPTPEPTPEHAQAKGDESDEQDQNATPRSSHTSLSALVLENNNGAAITLRPTFAATTTEYRAAVKHNVSRITVTATAAAGATLEYLDVYGQPARRRRCRHHRAPSGSLGWRDSIQGQGHERL